MDYNDWVKRTCKNCNEHWCKNMFAQYAGYIENYKRNELLEVFKKSCIYNNHLEWQKKEE